MPQFPSSPEYVLKVLAFLTQRPTAPKLSHFSLLLLFRVFFLIQYCLILFHLFNVKPLTTSAVLKLAFNHIFPLNQMRLGGGKCACSSFLLDSCSFFYWFYLTFLAQLSFLFCRSVLICVVSGSAFGSVLEGFVTGTAEGAPDQVQWSCFTALEVHDVLACLYLSACSYICCPSSLYSVFKMLIPFHNLKMQLSRHRLSLPAK